MLLEADPGRDQNHDQEVRVRRSPKQANPDQRANQKQNLTVVHDLEVDRMGGMKKDLAVGLSLLKKMEIEMQSQGHDQFHALHLVRNPCQTLPLCAKDPFQDLTRDLCLGQGLDHVPALHQGIKTEIFIYIYTLLYTLRQLLARLLFLNSFRF